MLITNSTISKAVRSAAITHTSIICTIIQLLSLKLVKTIRKISILKMLATI
jgi:hypothetical protein